jgi:protein-tyrosine-phosphatase
MKKKRPDPGVSFLGLQGIAKARKSIYLGYMGLFREKFTIAVVCKANITRSAYMQGYMKHYLRTHMPYARKKIRILSAGVQARQGSSASQVVQHVARTNGFSLSGHHSSPMSRKLVKAANVILVMEQGQKDAILKYLPETREKTFLVTEYLRTDDEDGRIGEIPDPTGLDAPEYKAFIEVAHAEVDRIFRELGREGII